MWKRLVEEDRLAAEKGWAAEAVTGLTQGAQVGKVALAGKENPAAQGTTWFGHSLWPAHLLLSLALLPLEDGQFKWSPSLECSPSLLVQLPPTWAPVMGPATVLLL